MATLATQSIVTAGLTPAFVAAAGGGDKCLPGAGTYLHVKNGGGSPVTVTLVTPATVDTLAVGDRAIVVAAGAEAKIAVPDTLYRNPTDGLADITYSGVTSVTVGVFRI
jgi:hypothetical protein